MISPIKRKTHLVKDFDDAEVRVHDDNQHIIKDRLNSPALLTGITIIFHILGKQASRRPYVYFYWHGIRNHSRKVVMTSISANMAKMQKKVWNSLAQNGHHAALAMCMS